MKVLEAILELVRATALLIIAAALARKDANGLSCWLTRTIQAEDGLQIGSRSSDEGSPGPKMEIPSRNPLNNSTTDSPLEGAWVSTTRLASSLHRR
jgi:hypothetical protein